MSQYQDWELVEGIWKVQEKKNVTFIHADNMAFLRKCKEEMMFKYFHVGIVDPPYAIDVTKMNLGATKDSKPKTYERGDWDGEVPTQEYWDLLTYCCRDLIVWGGNYFTKELPFSGRCFYVWDKKNNGMSFADCELALTTFDENARIIPCSRNKKTDLEGEKRHDTQKPSYLYEYLHEKNQLRGKRVLDTHGGSFSHAVASYITGVKLTIMDKQESYYNKALEVCSNATVVQRLF